jgi:hypothetical protein
MELNPLPVAPLVLKFGIHLGLAGRKGVRGGEEEGWSEGVESFRPSQIGQQHATAMFLYQLIYTVGWVDF